MAHKTWQDQITLGGVKLYPRIGTTPEERSIPQECVADITLWGDFEAAAATDDLNKSIDYCQVLSKAQEIASIREYNLLETLAYKIVRAVIQGFPVSRVKIRLQKRPAVLLDQVEHVEVVIEES